MNRAVKDMYERLSWKSFGYFVIRTYEYAPEVYKRNRKYHDQNNKMANPYELAKYGIKILKWLPWGEGKVSLKDMQQINDALEIIEFWKFSDQFGYCEDENAFAVMGNMIKGTSKMKAIWDKLEPKRVEKAWTEAKNYLQAPEGGEPILAYETD